ncbi:hypothetical protein GCM10010302_62270 [Streptomyces polychromogenes]|uniref:Ppx/GppA family phosphatase n=1 Tax=Streptomyces polychromogenes TaxID=67342 RepID=A0ABN0VQF6_9ACTN
MDEQGGAGGVPLHEDDDARRRRGPHAGGDASRKPPRPEPGPVRREDTDEASRLDHPGVPEPDEPRKHRGGGKGPDEL